MSFPDESAAPNVYSRRNLHTWRLACSPLSRLNSPSICSLSAAASFWTLSRLDRSMPIWASFSTCSVYQAGLLVLRDKVKTLFVNVSCTFIQPQVLTKDLW